VSHSEVFQSLAKFTSLIASICQRQSRMGRKATRSSNVSKVLDIHDVQALRGQWLLQPRNLSKSYGWFRGWPATQVAAKSDRRTSALQRTETLPAWHSCLLRFTNKNYIQTPDTRKSPRPWGSAPNPALAAWQGVGLNPNLTPSHGASGAPSVSRVRCAGCSPVRCSPSAPLRVRLPRPPLTPPPLIQRLFFVA
jgi:hypothetical protein